jgi:hypothetical protein
MAGGPLWLCGFNHPAYFSGGTSTYSQAAFNSMFARGFRVVRPLVRWAHIEPNAPVGSTHTYNQTYLQTLDLAIARAKAAGLWSVINCLHLFGSGGMDPTYVPSWASSLGGDSITVVQRSAGPYLTMLANRYANESAVAALDLVNEPYVGGSFNDATDQTRIMRMYDALITQVRNGVTGFPGDPNTICQVEPAWGDSDPSQCDFTVISAANRKNLAYQLHSYYSGLTNAYGSNGAQNQAAGNYYWGCSQGDFDNSAESNNAISDHLALHVNKAKAAGIPTILGEFGDDPLNGGQNEWINAMVANSRSLQMPYIWWEFRTSQCYSASDTDGTWNGFVDRFAPGTVGASPYGALEGTTTPATSGKLQTTAQYPYLYVPPDTGTTPPATRYTDATATDGHTYGYQVRGVFSTGTKTALAPVTPLAVVMPAVSGGSGTPSTPTGFVGTASGRTITFNWNAGPTGETAILDHYELNRNGALVANIQASAPTLTAVEESATGTGNFQWTFSTGWTTALSPLKSGGSEAYTAISGSSASLAFSTGTGVVLYGAKASHHGNATITMDGGPAMTVSCYSAVREEVAVLFDSPDAPTRLTAGAISGGNSLLQWTPPPSPPEGDYFLQSKANGTATWINPSSLDASRTSFLVSGLTAGSSYDFRLCARDAAGLCSVFAYATVGTGTPASSAHTLRVVVAGTSPAGSTGTTVALDRADVTTAGGGTATTYVDSPAPLGPLSYTLVASGVDLSDSAPTSPPLTFNVAPPAPAVGSWSVAMANNLSSATVTWQAPPSGVDVVDVLRDGNFVHSTAGTSGSSWVDTSIAPNTSYSYTLRYSAGGVAGPASSPLVVDTIIGQPPAPVDSDWSVALNADPTKADVSWAAAPSGEGITQTQVLRNGTVRFTGTASAGSFQDTGLVASTVYSYTLRYSASGTLGPSSGVKSVDTTPATPGAPTPSSWSATLNGADRTRADITWQTAPAGVTGVQVLRNGGGIFTSGVATAGSFQDSGLVANTVYSYTLRYINSGVFSAQSTVKTVDTTAPSTGYVTLVANGDVMGGSSQVNNTGARVDELLAIDPGLSYIGVGDISNNTGLRTEYFSVWEGSSMKKHMGRTLVVPGSHDGYGSGGGNDVNGQFFLEYFTPGAQTGPWGYFSKVLDDHWLLIGMNYDLGDGGQPTQGSDQQNWLTGIVNGNKTVTTNNGKPRFIICMMHPPHYTVCSGDHPDDDGAKTWVRSLWMTCVNAYPYCKLALSAHCNQDYGRFTPRAPNNNVDQAGIYHYVVSGGGCCNAYSLTSSGGAGAAAFTTTFTTSAGGVTRFRLKSNGFESVIVKGGTGTVASRSLDAQSVTFPALP